MSSLTLHTKQQLFCFSNVIAELTEVPLELQLREANCRIKSHQSKGCKFSEFLSPMFLQKFPAIMDNHISVDWDTITGVFERMPFLPITLIDMEILDDWFMHPSIWEVAARFICTICMPRIWWSCEGLMSVHNEYTGYTLKHLLLRHMYNLSLPNLHALLFGCDTLVVMLSGRPPTGFCSLLLNHSTTTTTTTTTTATLALYCAVLYIAASVDTSRMVFWDRSVLR